MVGGTHELHGFLQEFRDADGLKDSLPETPCSRGQCSRDSQPVSPSTPTVQSSPDQWLCLSSILEITPSGACPIVAQAWTANDYLLMGSILRPPCFGGILSA